MTSPLPSPEAGPASEAAARAAAFPAGPVFVNPAPRSPRIATNRRALRTAERLVSLAVREGRLERAVGLAATAARFASQRHPGQFCSVPLEENLGEVSAAWFGHGRPAVAALDSPAWPAQILHVCTRTVALGGHTRWLERLIAADTGRHHSIVVTAPDGSPPLALQRAVAVSGGKVTYLPVTARTWHDRALALRDLAAPFDAVVLTSDPGDPLPSVAFGVRLPGKPVVRFNHADHLFWLGAGISDLLIEFRPLGAALSVERRGYPANRQVVLPLPIDRTDLERQAPARAALGLPEDAAVLLSVGAAYKFGRPGTDGGGDGDACGNEPRFSALVDAALLGVPNLVILAVGPDPADGWSEVVSRWGGRFRVVPPTRQLGTFMAAADIFLNPFPVGSDTVMWEAAAAALPIVMLQPAARELGLMRGDPSELGPGARAAVGVAELVDAIADLTSSPDQRARVGALASAAAEARLMPAWGQSLSPLWDAVRDVRYATMRAADLAPRHQLSLVDPAVMSWSSDGPLWRHLVRRITPRIQPTGPTSHGSLS